MGKITIPSDIIQSATQAQIRRAGSNFAESISAYLGNPITGEIIVSSSDKKGLVWIYGLGSEPSSAFTAANTGLNKQDMYLGAPILVTRGVNGYIVTGKNPDTSPEFYEGSEAINAQEPIYISQLYFGTIHPYGDSLQLLVIGATYDDYDVVDIVTADFATETVQDTLAANITLPTVNNTAKGVLIQIDPATETLSYKQSATYAATIKPRQAYRAGLLPTVDDGLFRVGYFNLTYGVTTFTYGDIWSCPEFISSGDTGVLNNYAAVTAPTANDDSGDGYSVGSLWVDTASLLGNFYYCADATVAAAVWVEVIGATLTQTLSNKTLNQPAIGNFTDMNHNHANTITGGQITDAALSSAVGIAKGGTGQTSKTNAFDALSPLTTSGDIITHSGTDNIRVAVGTTNGLALTVDDTVTGGLAWAAPRASDGILFIDPTLQTWSNLNHGGGTYTEDTTNKRLTIENEDGNATLQIRGWYFTAPAPPYVATYYIRQQANLATNNGACAFHRQNSTTELRSICWRWDGTNLSIFVGNWNSATSLNASVVASTRFATEPKWFQIEDDNTDVFYRISPDGINWLELYTVARTTFLTPDELGFGMVLATASTYNAAASLLSLELT